MGQLLDTEDHPFTEFLLSPGHCSSCPVSLTHALLTGTFEETAVDGGELVVLSEMTASRPAGAGGLSVKEGLPWRSALCCFKHCI